jgi:tetratricopeptide (TPR) repeat protein
VTEKSSEQINFTDASRPLARVGLILAIFFALGFGWFAVRWQIGSLLAEFTSATQPNAPTVAEIAVALAPSDPMANWFRASAARDVFASATEKQNDALEKYERITRLAPNDYRWWIELGRARERADDAAGAEAAFRRAVELAPAYTFPQWQLGNFYLRQGENEKALAALRKSAASNSVYRQQVYSTLWDYFDRDARLLEEIAGDSPQMRADLALFFASKEQAPESLRVWNTLAPAEKSRYASVAKVIAQALFEKKYFRSAVGFAREIGTETGAEPEKIQNGGFESEIGLDGAYFNWKILSVEKVDARPDRTQKRDGSRSLRLAFNGFSGAQYNQTYQVVAVAPNARYRLSFWYRAENLRSAGNPLIEIVNANDDKLIKASEAFPSGTNDWRQVSLEFAAPPNAEGVVVRVGRAQCGAQCPIFGTIWLDDFQLDKL